MPRACRSVCLFVVHTLFTVYTRCRCVFPNGDWDCVFFSLSLSLSHTSLCCVCCAPPSVTEEAAAGLITHRQEAHGCMSRCFLTRFRPSVHTCSSVAYRGSRHTVTVARKLVVQITKPQKNGTAALQPFHRMDAAVMQHPPPPA